MSKKLLSLTLSMVLVAGLVFSMVGCAPEEEVVGEATWPVWDLRDGDYRGHFDDREHNVSVQITLENEEIVDVSLRWKQYDGVVYDTEDPEIPEGYVFTEDQIIGIAEQYETALEYLMGAQGKEEIVERLEHMEGNPGGTPLEEAIEPADVDGFSGATIRSGKLGSAVRDAFNRGLYRE